MKLVLHLFFFIIIAECVFGMQIGVSPPHITLTPGKAVSITLFNQNPVPVHYAAIYNTSLLQLSEPQGLIAPSSRKTLSAQGMDTSFTRTTRILIRIDDGSASLITYGIAISVGFREHQTSAFDADQKMRELLETSNTKPQKTMPAIFRKPAEWIVLAVLLGISVVLYSRMGAKGI